jgi:hypothetical protein
MSNAIQIGLTGGKCFKLKKTVTLHLINDFDSGIILQFLKTKEPGANATLATKKSKEGRKDELEGE